MLHHSKGDVPSCIFTCVFVNARGDSREKWCYFISKVFLSKYFDASHQFKNLSLR